MKLSHYEWDPEKDLIAEGGFAEVFKAKDTNTENRWVALKIYKEAVSRGTTGSTGQKKYSLEQEFAKIDGLSHTNIITFYGLEYIEHKDAMGRTASYPVLIMEYAGEGTLKELSIKQLSDQELEEIIVSIIKATGYLHSQGVIHRDLKPGNVLFSKDRNGKLVSKITDFGISKDVLGDKTIEQSFTEGVGTPHYMSPEQFFKKKFGLNGEVSERTDIWAIGVIIYQLLAGKRPFGHGIKDYELIRDEITQNEVDLTTIPEKYQIVITKCLEKEATKRAASANELLKLLEAQAYDEDVTVIPGQNSSINNPPVPEVKSKKKLLAFAIVGVLILVIGYGGFKWYQHSKAKELLAAGWDYYKDGKFKDAYNSYSDATDYNSGKAYYYLGLMNEQGRGITRNYQQGLKYADKAIDLDYEMAAYYKGDMFRYGWGVPVDSIKAISYYKQGLIQAKKLAAKEDTEAMHLYGLLLADKSLGILDSVKSFEYVKKAADKGHPIAKSNLATWYRNGLGIEKNCHEAIKLYEEGLAINFDRSIKGLGDMYYFENVCDDTIQDYKKAFKYYEIAAEQDNIFAQNSLGYMYQYGNGVTVDLDEALVWYTRAADGDHIPSINNIATIYEQKKNVSKAKEWYLKAAQKNDKYGMYNLGRIHGITANKEIYNLDSSNNWYRKAAKLEYSKAQLQLGNHFYGDKKMDSAFYWYEKAALQNYSLGEHNLGVMYENGHGCEQDYKKAIGWYEKAAAQGYSHSNYAIGKLYLNGKGVSQDYIKAKEWYLKAANQGNAIANDAIARMYFVGREGIPKDHYLARKWYKKGAIKGVLNSQYMYALMNENKQGGPQNYSKAREWYNKSARKGHGNSQQRLGTLYIQGNGGTVNKILGFNWTEKAAKGGNNEGERKLGLCYFYGFGVPKSKSQARYWLNKSCKNGNKLACKQIKELL